MPIMTEQMCQANRNGCNVQDHPSNGGLPFFVIRATEKGLAEETVKFDGLATGYVVVKVQGMIMPIMTEQMCQANRNGCNVQDHPSNGGVPFFVIRATEKGLAEETVKFD